MTILSCQEEGKKTMKRTTFSKEDIAGLEVTQVTNKTIV